MPKERRKQNRRHQLWAIFLFLGFFFSDAYANDCSVARKFEYVLASYPHFAYTTKQDSFIQLPSNALGVLFYIPPYPDTINIPALLEPSSFVISNLDKGIKLRVKIQRIYDAITPAQEEFRVSKEINDNPVTGLYRIGPPEGFEQGGNYEIRYLGKPGDSVSVHIGKAVNPASLAASKINVLAPRRELLKLRPTTACNGGSILAEVHNWEIAFPEDITPYEPLLFAFSSYRTPGKEFQKLEFKPPVGGNNGDHAVISQERIKGLVFSTCNPDTGETIPTDLKVNIRFLEISDQLFETPHVEIPIIQPKISMCSELRFLQESLDIEDGASYALALYVMTEHGFAHDPSKTKILMKSLLAATAHPNKQFSLFARSLTLSFSAQYLNSLGTWKESPDPDIGQLRYSYNLKSVGPLAVKDLETFKSVINAVTYVLSRPESASLEPEGEAIIFNVARKLKIQQVNGSIPKDLRLDIFVPALTEILIKGSKSDCKDAADTLALLGKAARSAIPTLLYRSKCDQDAAIAAAEISPNDSHVARKLRSLPPNILKR